MLNFTIGYLFQVFSWNFLLFLSFRFAFTKCFRFLVSLARYIINKNIFKQFILVNPPFEKCLNKTFFQLKNCSFLSEVLQLNQKVWFLTLKSIASSKSFTCLKDSLFLAGKKLFTLDIYWFYISNCLLFIRKAAFLQFVPWKKKIEIGACQNTLFLTSEKLVPLSRRVNFLTGSLFS